MYRNAYVVLELLCMSMDEHVHEFEIRYLRLNI